MNDLRRTLTPNEILDRGVLSWRIECLRDAGFEPPLARLLALDGRYDLHELLDLLDRGCPRELAVRILAPLDGGRPA